MKKDKIEQEKRKLPSSLKSYFVSLLGMVLSCAMFMSTTFAWFSVSIVSNNNQIQVGSLGASLLHHEGTEQIAVTNAHQVFDSSVKWLPNHAEVELLTIRNKGDMALDYKLQFELDSANCAFTDGMTMESVAKWFSVYCYEGDAANATDDLSDPNWVKVGTLANVLSRKIAVTKGTLELTGDTATVAIALHLQNNASEKIMGQKLSINVKLIANQKGYEEAVYASNAQALTAALAQTGCTKLTADISTPAATVAPYGNMYGFAVDGGVLDGNGHTLSVTGSGDTYAIMTSGGTIKNLNIDCGFRGIMLMYAQEDLILENVTIAGDGVGYPINTGEAGELVRLIATDSTFKGWNSFANIKSASFVGCEFGQGSYWGDDNDRVVKPYVDAQFTDCTFVQGLYIDLSALGTGCKITLKNCTVNGTVLTAENWQTLLDAIELPQGRTLEDCVIFQ